MTERWTDRQREFTQLKIFQFVKLVGEFNKLIIHIELSYLCNLENVLLNLVIDANNCFCNWPQTVESKDPDRDLSLQTVDELLVHPFQKFVLSGSIEDNTAVFGLQNDR